MKLATKYRLRVLLSPSLWSRNRAADQEFDKWLWDAMVHGAKPELYRPIPPHVSVHEVTMLGVVVWVNNAPLR